MVVCLCHAVSDRAVRAAIAAGARTVKDVAEMCGAGTDCGACCPMLAQLVAESRGAVYSDAHASPYLPTGGLHEGP